MTVTMSTSWHKTSSTLLDNLVQEFLVFPMCHEYNQGNSASEQDIQDLHECTIPDEGEKLDTGDWNTDEISLQ